MAWRPTLNRRAVLGGLAAAGTVAGFARPATGKGPIRFGLTPVFVTSDLALLAALKTYMEQATGRPVQLVKRRTYQEITALLISRQLDAAWICGYPFVAYRDALGLIAVPVWKGQTQYQSYLIARDDLSAHNLSDLRDTVHAFSDPDSNSGYLVTRAALLGLGTTPEVFFRKSFFTYGHRNVIRAVASGFASSGSVDGYVYEVLRETEPDNVRSVHIVGRSEWLGFPPIACPAGEAFSETTTAIQRALLTMADDAHGRVVLSILRLDGFRTEKPGHFDGIAAKMRFVRGGAQ
ncbi:MAG: PhnD/SsuA/transferrin family substrate-binding protein [Hyphomicrobiaceae bacterium]